MAQAGFTPIQLYYSTTASAVPTAGNLASGELAINISDGKLYYKNASNVVTLLATAGSVSSQWVTSGSDIYYNTGNVGIGTSSPNYSLTSYKGGAVANYLQVASGATGAGSLNGLLLGVDASGNGVINAQGGGVNLYTYVAGVLRTTIDSSGNLGLGVTPSAWQATFKAIDFSTTASLAGSSGGANLFNNAYWNGSNYIYKTTAAATRYLQSSGEHYWFTAPSGTAGNAITFTQAMTLDASGNLGINSTSPSTFGKVTVQVAGTTTPTNLTNVGPSSINLYAAANGGSTNSTMGIFGWNSTTGIGSGIGFSRENSGDWGTQIRFYTHPTSTTNIGDITERARISAAGGFSVGTTSDPGAGAIYATGNITAYFSDNRLKTRLGGIENALDKVEKLSGFYYEANETAQALGYKPKREVGVSAQEVQAVLPEVVSPAPVDQQYLTVDYERLVPLLIEAIKELRAEVRALKGV